MTSLMDNPRLLAKIIVFGLYHRAWDVIYTVDQESGGFSDRE